MRTQKGLSLIGLLLISGVLVFVALIGFKLMPAYVEFFAVKKAVNELAVESRGGQAGEIKKAFDRRATIDNITSITGADLEINKTGTGFEIIAAYTVQVPLFGNISACIDFLAEAGR
jgi:hypothetical protein